MSKPSSFIVFRSRPGLGRAFSLLLAGVLPWSGSAATFIVSTASDSGPGSLRQAITDANNNPGLDIISFFVIGLPPIVIQPQSPLPAITDPVRIDGRTQVGYAGLPLIEISGQAAGAGDGISINAGQSEVRGLAINRFAGYGIRLETGGGNVVEANHVGTDGTGLLARGSQEAGILIFGSSGNVVRGNLISGGNVTGLRIEGSVSQNNVVQGNRIGTDVTGLLDLGNSGNGIVVSSARGNIIGGADAAARNILAGNEQSGVYLVTGAQGNSVQGNYIGTDNSGTRALPNTLHGITVSGSSANILGGTQPGMGNLISGNGGQGILVTGGATENRVEGNRIGTSAGGTAAIPNALSGVGIVGSPGNTIGGSAPGARNVLSGNRQSGVAILEAGATGNIVAGNFIGVDSSGTAALANEVSGVTIIGVAGNVIGGTDPSARNILSGNKLDGITISDATAGTTIMGNYIGLDVSGEQPLGNAFAGIALINAAGSQIGGLSSAARNVISGNAQSGIYINGSTASGNTVRGNFIGTAASGFIDVANTFVGVLIDNAPNNLVGGSVPEARNIISGNINNGVTIQGAAATGNRVSGNYIGLNADGSDGVGNTWRGVGILGSPNNVIGGLAPGEGNIISANWDGGIIIDGAGATRNLVQGNFIGVLADLGTALGNGTHGVQIDSGASFNVIGGFEPGAGNTIANAVLLQRDGVRIFFEAGPGNAVYGNAIYLNAGLGIDLAVDGVSQNDDKDTDGGGNLAQNFPVITQATSGQNGFAIQGFLDSSPSGTFLLQFYLNSRDYPGGYGQGEKYIGATTIQTDAAGHANFNVSIAAARGAAVNVTATATDGAGNSSEFSLAQKIDSRQPLITWPKPADIVYGTPIGGNQLNASAGVPGTFAYTPGAGAVLQAGSQQSLNVVFTPADTASFDPSSSSVQINVKRAPLTIRAESKSKAVGAPLPPLTVTYEGFVNGDNASHLTAPAIALTTATASSPGGTYSISVSGASSPNYEITFISGTLTVIGKVAPVITWSNPPDIVYGTQLSAAQLNATANVPGVFTYNPAIGAVVAAGDAQKLDVVFVPSDASSFDNASASVFLRVKPAPLALTANNVSRPFGSPNPPFTFSATGFVNGEGISSLSGSPSLVTTAGDASPPGSYPIQITQGTLAAPNYSLIFFDGTLTIGKTSQTIDFQPLANKKYGDPAFDLGATASSGLPVAFSVVSGPGTLVNNTLTITGAGQIRVRASQPGNDTFAPASPVDQTVNVAKVALAILAENKTRSTGAANPEFTARITGFVAGDSLTSLTGQLAFSTTADASSPPGTYPINVSGVTSGNYDIIFGPGTLTIENAGQTIDFPALANKKYGDPAFDLVATASSGLPVAFSVVSGPGTLVNNTLTITGAGQILVRASQPGNATFTAATPVERVLHVAKAPLAILAENKTIPAGAANPVFTAKITGFVGSDGLANLTGQLVFSTTADATSPAGAYPITVSGVTSDNYDIIFGAGTLTIIGAPVITVQPQSTTNNLGSDATFTVAATGEPRLLFQWMFNGAALTNQTNAVLLVANVATTNSGVYQVVVGNGGGSVVSSNAVLIVRPAILSDPVNQTIVEGSNALFTVAADGTPPLRFQWNVDGAILPFATNASLIVSNVQASGSYSVNVFNDGGSASSKSATLEVLRKPFIFDHPQGRAATLGGGVTFSVGASGTQPLSYRWRFNGEDIPGQTGFSLVLSNISLTASGDYSVVVTNVAGSSTSLVARLTVDQFVSISQPPTNKTAVLGATARFVVVADGTGLHYQWRFNGKAIPGETSPILQIPDVTPGNEGGYSVDVTNLVSSISSDPALLTVLVPPSITAQPLSKTNLVGSSVTFDVSASGSEPRSYQWRFKNANLLNKTNSSLTVANIQPVDAGDYLVVVSNAAGQTNSAPAILTVYEPVAISASTPLDVVAKQGDTVKLDVAATGTQPFGYQWYFESKLIAGATNSSLSFTNAQDSISGRYSVEVTNPAGTRASRVAQVKIFVPPTIIRQPISQTNVVGDDVLMNIIISGTEPLSYQWSRDNTDLPLETTNTIRLNPVRTNQAGLYRVRVSNFAGTTNSAATAVVVNEPVFIQTGPLSRTVAAGTSVSFSVIPGGTPPFAYQWRADNFNVQNGIDIGGATASVLTLTNAQPTNSARYQVVVTNVAGSAVSAEAILSVRLPVQIQQSPQSKTLRERDDLILNVLATGDGPFSYTWRKDGQILPSETSSVLVRNGIIASQGGVYLVAVSNSVSGALAQPAIITVKAAPTVTPLPARLDAQPGQTVTLTAVAQGDQPFSYQWLLNGVDIPGQTAATLTMSSVVSSNSGSYSVTVANIGGVATTPACSVVVATPSLPFADNIANSGTASSPTGSLSGDNLTATAEPGEPEFLPGKRGRKSVWFSWQAPNDGIATFNSRGTGFDSMLAVFTGAVTASSTPLASDDDSAGFKTSTVTFNATAGSVYRIGIDGVDGESGLIVVNWSLQVTATKIPQITRQPLSYTSLAGSSVEFSVAAQIAGGGQLTYQWHFDGVPIPGQTATNLILANVQSTNVGGYSVRVTGGPLAVQTVTSKTAFLQLTTDPGLVGPDLSATDRPGLSGGSSPRTIGSQRIHLLASVSRGFSGSQIFSTKTAVKDAGEPNHCGTVGGASTWFLYEAQTNGVLQLTTAGSTFNTILAVYTGPGTDFASLVPAGCSTNQPGVVSIPTVKGTTYFIVVDGVRGARGTVQLGYNLEQPPLILQQPFGTTVQPNGASQGIHLSALTSTQTVVLGGSVKLTVAATNRFGYPNLSYQWRFNGGDLSGATNNTLTLTNVSTRRAGDYSVLIVNYAGSVESDAVRVEVITPVQLITPPQNATEPPGGTVTFSVAASGSAPIRYQWRLNGSVITSGTNAVLTVTNVQAGTAGTYEVQISNAANSVTSSAILSLQQPPAFTAQPTRFTTVVSGGNVTLTAAATGGAPLGYQWRLNGVNLPGAFSSSLALTNVQAAAGGDYSLVVSNSIRSIISDLATVIVNVPITLAQVPQSQTVVAGSKVSLAVTALGTAPLAYQWNFNGTNLASATNATLEIVNVLASHAGAYRVTVTNIAGSVTTSPATLSVNVLPAITQQPGSLSVPAGTNATFSVTATGTGTLRYQWKLDGVALPNATNSTLVLTNVSRLDAGDYSVAVQNEAGSAPSNPATLSVIVPPTIVQQPRSQTVVPGGSAALNVTVDGTAPLAYQWTFQGTNLPAATNSILALANIQSASSGYYQVVVTNLAGSVSSAEAFVGFDAAPSITEEPADLTVSVGATATFRVRAVGNPPLRYQWQFNRIAIPAATNAVLVITNVTEGYTGKYSVLVGGPAGSSTSRQAQLVVAATATVQVTGVRYTGNTFEITASGPATGTFTVQSSTNLVDWTAIGTGVIVNGTINYIDNATANQPNRFYRIALP